MATVKMQLKLLLETEGADGQSQQICCVEFKPESSESKMASRLFDEVSANGVKDFQFRINGPSCSNVTSHNASVTHIISSASQNRCGERQIAANHN